MPQKKNPDPAEMIRGRSGKNFGNLQAMLTTLKGLPLSYYKDMQEDKNLVFDSYDVLMGSILIANQLIKNLHANKQRMLFLANEGYTTATDFADYLVQKNDLSFREAYKISAKLVNYAEKKKKKLNEDDLIEHYQKFYSNDYFVRILSKGKLASTHHVSHSNFCDIGIKIDTRVGRLIITSALDNLVKGASGQAIQNMNIMQGFEEKLGLQSPGISP